MKLKQINYDNDEVLETVTVTLSRAEAIAIVNIAGQLNGYAHTNLGLGKGDSLYDGLAGIFEAENEDGYPSLDINLETINQRKDK